MVPVAGTNIPFEPRNYVGLFCYYRKLERILASFIANISPVIRHYFGRLNRPPGGGETSFLLLLDHQTHIRSGFQILKKSILTGRVAILVFGITLYAFP